MKISEKIAIIIGTVLFIIFVTGLAWSISTGLAGFARSIPILDNSDLLYIFTAL